MISSAFPKIYRNEIIYGCLYALSHSFIFHNSELWWLAHLAVIPLLAGIKNCSSGGEALGFGYTAGLASN
ncbi:MAG: hypothetical protein KC649_07800, partial [Candidatus Omnitrophica bacterium]|nr:hypothetical protein [Candidatus Omnitrophota bacterium]